MEPVFIYDAIRTPRGRARDDGGLHEFTPQALLACLYESLAQRNRFDPEMIGEIVLGCVTQQGEQAANIAKTSALFAGWPSSIGGITLNRFCSSSLDAINFAMLKIAAGQEQQMIAGGVEMMSRVPMLSDKARVFTDPAFAASCQILLMGSGADLIASINDISREEADEVALASQRRASEAIERGYFTSVLPMVNPADGRVIKQDECVRSNTTMASLAALPPAFADLGAAGADAFQLQHYPQLDSVRHIHTAGNSPAMADAASVLLLGSEALGEKLALKPRAQLLAATNACDDHLQVLGGCEAATSRLMREAGLEPADVDLFEIHEAFAATILRCQRNLKIPADKLNVNGGVIALGHPMGATGAIMMGTLLDELERRGERLGIVAASGAAGSGSALLIESLGNPPPRIEVS